MKNGCCAFFGHSPSTVPAAHYACDDSSPTLHRSAVMFNRLSKLVKRKEDGAGAGDEPSPVAPAPALAPAPSPAFSSGSAGALWALQSVHGGGGAQGMLRACVRVRRSCNMGQCACSLWTTGWRAPRATAALVRCCFLCVTHPLVCPPIMRRLPPHTPPLVFAAVKRMPPRQTGAAALAASAAAGGGDDNSSDSEVDAPPPAFDPMRTLLGLPQLQRGSQVRACTGVAVQKQQ